MKKLLNQKEYCDHIGRSRATLYRYIKRGVLNGATIKKNNRLLIDHKKADKLLHENLNPISVKAMAETSGKKRSPKKQGQPILSCDQVEDIKKADIDKNMPLADAQRVKTIWQAANEKLKHQNARGDLIDKQAAKNAITNASIKLRDSLLDLWDRISPVIVSMETEHDIRQYGISETTALLMEFSDKLLDK